MNETELSSAWVREYLQPGESLLWHGRPAKGHLLSAVDIFLIPFSLFWGGFAFFWEYMVLRYATAFPMWLFGIPFVCVGLYLIAGRFVYTAIRRSKTRYAVTSQRILCQCGNRLDALDRKQLPAMQLVVRKDKTGTISFGAMGVARIFNGVFPLGQRVARGPLLILENVENVQRVERLIRSAAQ